MELPAPTPERGDLYPEEIKIKLDALALAGFHEQVKMYETLYAAWYRTVSAYQVAIPFVDDRKECATAEGAMHVVTWTINNWGPQIPGTPVLDNEKVRQELADDEAWHRNNRS